MFLASGVSAQVQEQAKKTKYQRKALKEEKKQKRAKNKLVNAQKKGKGTDVAKAKKLQKKVDYHQGRYDGWLYKEKTKKHIKSQDKKTKKRMKRNLKKHRKYQKKR